jgi:predicted O-methyltransferase YrrM
MFERQIQGVMDRVDRLRHTVDDHWQIPRDEAEVLAQLIRLGRCVSICEVGVSYGYSTLHLAAATKPLGGHVHAFDISEKKIAAATRHLTEAGLIDAVSLHLGDARERLQAIKPARPFDCVFLDADKSQSMGYLSAVLPLLAPRCAIITDNTLTHAKELAAFREHLASLPGAASVQVPVGNGFELTLLGAA